ncbi:hypothetical protein DWQ65_09770 [Treponema phagedenis]|uniref:Uncharacterized protein n=1 Tax=Treponema phagedenis TaxID=162 RepID=A0AAE6M637_TREPH|nr:hypothetical protein FUT79_00835 [Treponema phagedenis]QEJ97078.1 hypothetical protein FUT82_03150 [Treponema phagedenis]QEK02989.1 hypothetical protein FUT83_03625 [Treponema phagedenis]QEK08616.1 hypothetical protein FUT81_03610 [Treponema phagedenis]QSH95560.1 hypothetical protein C5O78_11160 [Treponema phagedenis]
MLTITACRFSITMVNCSPLRCVGLFFVKCIKKNAVLMVIVRACGQFLGLPIFRIKSSAVCAEKPHAC